MILALQDSLCSKISIIARKPSQAKELSAKFGIKYIDKVKNINQHFDLLVNTTPASNQKEHEMFSILPFVHSVFDLVVSQSETELIMRARSKGYKTIDGIEMSKRQLKKQFEIYTGIKCEISIIDDIIKSLYMKK